MYRIELQNKETKEITVFNNLEDLNYGEKLYFKFLIKTIEMADGEYTLNLYEDDFIIHTDTLRIGDFDVKGIQYKKGENLFVDTTLTARTEVKEIELDITKKNIYPSDGIDAMTKVVVNAQPVYDNGYNAGRTEGYNTGKADGYNEGYETGISESYDIGYNKGAEDGYKTGYDKGAEDGYTDGIADQKAKLTSITITENGKYENEDGYNLIDVNVKGEIEIDDENTQVLNVVKNGTYGTDYSKIEDVYNTGLVTGYFDDNTPFYDYAQLYQQSIKTDSELRLDGRIEMWWKFNNTEVVSPERLYGVCGSSNKTDGFYLNVRENDNVYSLIANIGKKKFSLDITTDKWYHIILSVEDGFVVNGEKIGDFSNVSNVDISTAYLNEAAWGYVGNNAANGYFGMVKINNDIYIPTENGFINYTTNMLLELHREGTYEYAKLPTIEGNLIRTVNVNILPQINIAQEGITFSYFNKNNVPEWADWSGITNMTRMFYFSDLTELPMIDTSNVIDMSYVANYASMTSVPLWDTSSVTNMSYAFANTKITTLPNLNTSNVTNFSNFVYGCSNLTDFPEIDTSNAAKFDSIFGSCTNIESIPALNAGKATSISSFFGYSELKKLTDFGGLIDLKLSMNDGYAFAKVPNLTYESCINILNGLYDFVGNGVTPTSSQGKLKVHANFLTLVGDELSIGTNKGWVITA